MRCGKGGSAGLPHTLFASKREWSHEVSEVGTYDLAGLESVPVVCSGSKKQYISSSVTLQLALLKSGRGSSSNRLLLLTGIGQQDVAPSTIVRSKELYELVGRFGSEGGLSEITPSLSNGGGGSLGARSGRGRS